MEEVAFDHGKDPDVEFVKDMPMLFEDWFDLQTFKSSGIMAWGPLHHAGACATLMPVVQPLRSRPPC